MFVAKRSVTGVWLVLLLSACFRTTAPEGWLSTPAVAQREAYGGWISVQYTRDSTVHTVEGELIATAKDSLHVLTTDSLVSLSTDAITSATLTAYDAQHGRLITWAVVGSLSTISHGWGLILTLPTWIIAGTTTAASASRGPRIQSMDATLLQPYARFPQGLPPGVDRRTLRQKRAGSG